MATLVSKALSAAVSTRRRVSMVLLGSGTFGFLLGISTSPTLQSAVESAQILAGVVSYPSTPSTPPALTFYTSIWSLVHQSLALLLTLGLSERQLSILLGGVLGMVSLQALAMIVYALSGDLLLALLSGAAIAISRSAEFGAAYPISLLGGPSADAGIGLALAALAGGLLGAGSFRTSGLLFGVLPAVDLTVGLWMSLVFAAVLVAGFRNDGAARRRAGSGFMAGIGVAILSLLVQIGLSGLPSISTQVGDPYLTRFVTAWDPYRRPIGVFADGVYLNAIVLVLAAVWLTALKDDLAPASRLLLKVALVTSVSALGLGLLTWSPPDRLPAIILALMPGRLLNVSTMIAAAIILGLIGAYRDTRWAAPLGFLTVIGLLASGRSMAWDWLAGGRRPGWAGAVDPWFVFQGSAVLLIALALHRANTETSELRSDRWTRASRLASGLLLAALAAGWWRAAAQAPGIADWRNEPLYQVAAEGRGLLLPGSSLRWIQLRTRRPLLMDGDLTSLPFALEGAADAAKVITDVYGVDFFNPPDEARHSGVLPHLHTKMIWEGYSQEDWRRIRRDFHVMDVLTGVDWTLNLPVTAQSRELRLHHIPE
jgi:hypothetical protein